MDYFCISSVSCTLKDFDIVGKWRILSLVLLQNGTDYGFLVRQNSELLRALDKLEKTCNTLREENGLLVGLKITVCAPLIKDFVETRTGPQNI